MDNETVEFTKILRPKAQAPIDAIEATTQLLSDCQFEGTGWHSETVQRVRLYVHIPTGETLWV